MSPPRGEVWLVDLGIAAKVRPCLVFSVPVTNQDRSLVCLVPHTTSTRGSPYEVQCRARFLQPGAFDAQSIVTVPTARLVRRLGVLAEVQLADIETAVMAWLGIARNDA
jgi:mRNA interferase MazF